MNEEKTKKSFHITVTSLTDGEVVVDTDTNCIIASFNTEKGSDSLVLTKCNIVDLLTGIAAVEKSVQNAKNTVPDPLKVLLDLTLGNNDE